MVGVCVVKASERTIASSTAAGERGESRAAIARVRRQSGSRAGGSRGGAYLPVLMVFQMRVRRRSIFCGMACRANSLAILSCGG